MKLMHLIRKLKKTSDFQINARILHKRNACKPIDERKYRMTEFTGYRKGVNLGGWLSQCCHTKEHYDSFITEEDIKVISGWMTDHVRLPIDYNLLEDENGNFKEDGFGYIDNAVKWAKNYGSTSTRPQDFLLTRVKMSRDFLKVPHCRSVFISFGSILRSVMR